jgi:ParB-like chromosome segregation protein Spo0J
MEQITLDYLAPGQIKPRLRRYRHHSPRQMALLEASLKERGCIEPVLVDSENRIVCGEAVVAAALSIGLNRIPVVRADHLTDAQLRAYALAANKLAELGGYDEELLALELADVAAQLGDYDLTNLGFEAADIDRLFGLTCVEQDATANDVPPRDRARAIAQLGDLWLLGKHRLLCGDALLPESYAALMQGDLAQLILSDVPYNLSGCCQTNCNLCLIGRARAGEADFQAARDCHSVKAAKRWSL